MDLASLSDAWAATVGGRDRLSALPAERTYGGVPAADLLPADSKVAAGFRFDERQKLGEGGQGVVYRVEQRLLEREVAVKVPHSDDPASFRSFMAEAVVTGRLEHPGIVPVHALGARENGEVFLAMRLLQGSSWRARLASERSQLDHLETLIQVGNAVGYAHSRSIVHCDLKPANVMVGAFGEVYVLDWGLAVSVGAPEPDSWLAHHTQIDSPRGTPAYIAPELAAGDGASVGPATDVYLLGAILFEILTGHPPHAGRSLVEALMQVASGRRPVLPPECNPELARICRQSLARDPRERPADAAAFVGLLKQYLRHRESYQLSQRARLELQACQASARSGREKTAAAPLYERLAATVARFRQAAELADSNQDARLGEAEARQLYAQTALARGDLGLAEAQAARLAAADAGPLLERIGAARAARQAERRHKRRLRRALLVCVLAVLGAVGVAVTLVARSSAEASRAQRQRLARELEAEALAGALSPRARRLALERSVALDPERFTAWRTLGALALAEQDWEAALQALGQARRLEANEQEARYLEALALQGVGELGRASRACRGLLAEGYRTAELRRQQAQLCWRLGRLEEARELVHAILAETPADTQALRLRIACLEGTGSYRTLEQDRWSLLVQDPQDAEALADLVRARLRRLDIAALDDLWRDWQRRLSRSEEEAFFRIQTGQSEMLQAQLLGGEATLSERLRAALSLSLFPSPSSRAVLSQVRDAADTPAVLREAAEASLLLVAPPDLEGWAQRASQVSAGAGAAQALTLFELSPGALLQEPGPLESLLHARGSLLRAAVTLWLARAAVEDPERAPQVRTLLEGLRYDPDPEVRQTAELAWRATGLLAGLEGELQVPAVLLAWRLASASAQGPAGLADAARQLLDRAIEQVPSAALLRERAAWFLARRLEQAGRADLARARSLAPDDRATQLLALQLQLRSAEQPAELALLGSLDPAAHEELLARAAFEAETGFPALPGPGGSSILSFDLRQEGRPPLPLDALAAAFDMALADARLQPEGLEVEHHSYLRSRFSLAEIDRVAVRGPARLHLMVDATLRDSRLGYAVFLRNRGIEMRIDDELSVFAPAPAELLATELRLDRAGAELFGDGRRLLGMRSVARNRRGTGRFSVGVIRQQDEGGGQLSFLQVQGRLSPRAYPRGAWSGTALTPLAGNLRLRAGPVALETPLPPTLAKLREQGLELAACGVWQARRFQPQLVALPGVFGDLELRARLTFDASPTNSAGLALRAQVGDKAAVRFALREVPDTPGTTRRTLELNSQRSDRWDVPQFAANWDSDTVCLVLRREGEFIRGAYGPDFDTLQHTGPAFYFPMDGPVSLCLFARSYDEEQLSQARFELVDMAGERE